MSVLVVSVEAVDTEACADWLFQLGATAVEERLDADRVELVAGFPDDDLALAARSVLGERWPSRLESTGDEASWRDEWLKWIEPVQVGPFIVHAPWHDPATWVGQGEPLSIDPGRAFGSGHHPSTRLALMALDSAVNAGASVLDVGCGTGILSIAAAKSGAGSVLGLDLDHDIIEVARANAEANGVQDIVELRTDRLDTLDDRFDVAVANIVIVDLVPLVPKVLELADRVILSGFLDDQFDTVLGGLDLDATNATAAVERSTFDGWGCVTIGRSRPTA